LDQPRPVFANKISVGCTDVAQVAFPEMSLQSSTHEKTMMICNLPCMLGVQDLHDAMNVRGFEGTYDYTYLPLHRNSRKHRRVPNVGYSFVNFRNGRDAERFAAAFHDFQFPLTMSSKKCTVKVADLQGFNSLKKAAQDAVVLTN